MVSPRPLSLIEVLLLTAFWKELQQVQIQCEIEYVNRLSPKRDGQTGSANQVLQVV